MTVAKNPSATADAIRTATNCIMIKPSSVRGGRRMDACAILVAGWARRRPVAAGRVYLPDSVRRPNATPLRRAPSTGINAPSS